MAKTDDPTYNRVTTNEQGWNISRYGRNGGNMPKNRNMLFGQINAICAKYARCPFYGFEVDCNPAVVAKKFFLTSAKFFKKSKG